MTWLDSIGSLTNVPMVGIGTVMAMLVLLLAGCATGPTVRVDKDPNANLRAYRTFAFFVPAAQRGLLPPLPLPEPNAQGGPFRLPPLAGSIVPESEQYTSLQRRHVHRAVREQLERLGYVYDELHPDLRVNAVLHVDEKFELYTTPGAFGYVGLSGAVNSYYYRQGTLSVDLVDVRRMTLVWQGIAEGSVTTKAAKEPSAAIEAAVEEIFAAFPGTKEK